MANLIRQRKAHRGSREQGAGSREQGTRKKSCVPHYYDKCGQC
ncbi:MULTISPECIES: hypothetical protein [Moorena]|nr:MULTISPECIES: hypothetical protein [Moorena]